MIIIRKQSLRRALSRGLCAFLAAIFAFYCEPFLSLAHARSDDSPLRRTAETKARNRLDSWDRPFGAVISEAKTALFHYDGQLSTRQLTDQSAQVTDSYTYDAFGVIRMSSGSTPNNYRYAGEQYEPNAGYYYLRSRYFSEAVGRFISHDPFPGYGSDPASLHKYLYVNSQPVGNVDPSGMVSLGDLLASIAIMNILLYLIASANPGAHVIMGLGGVAVGLNFPSVFAFLLTALISKTSGMYLIFGMFSLEIGLITLIYNIGRDLASILSSGTDALAISNGFLITSLVMKAVLKGEGGMMGKATHVPSMILIPPCTAGGVISGAPNISDVTAKPLSLDFRHFTGGGGGFSLGTGALGAGAFGGLQDYASSQSGGQASVFLYLTGVALGEPYGAFGPGFLLLVGL